MQASHIAATGLNSFQQQMQVLANNLTNTETFGFKSHFVATSDVFYRNLQQAGVIADEASEPRPIGTQIGSGTKIVGTYRNLIQGDLKNTGRALDVAITGNGYFAVQLPNGRVGYTRAGNFKISPANRSLVTSDGKQLLSEGAPIKIDEGVSEDKIVISSDGTVTINGNSIREQNITIYNFPNENGLEAIGNNISVVTSGSGEAIAIDSTAGDRFIQRHLEMSNVSAIEELTKLIALQRAYEYCSKILKVQDSMNDSLTKI